jgi:ComF family protein
MGDQLSSLFLLPSSFFGQLLGLLFPDRCAGCGAFGALLCEACKAALKPYPGGDKPIAELDGAEVAHLYGGALRPAIHALKYRGRRRIAAPLGDLMAAHLWAHPLRADALLPVPLHPSRQRERGYNQSELLAERVSASCGLPIIRTGLERVRATSKQAQQSSVQGRRENMRGAFVWRGGRLPPHVLLIDDVLTTGATLAECAAALRDGGAVGVRGLALARSRPKTIDRAKTHA